MNRTTLQNAIRERFHEDAEITRLEKKEWMIDKETGHSWKDYLTRIFEARLKGAEDRGVESEVIDETRRFLRHLETFTSDSQLSSFSAKTGTKPLEGWAIDDEIVFCLAKATEE